MIFKFDNFLADSATGELRLNGARIEIQDQPFRILVALLERPGELITREDLQKGLWPADTFVDFEQGLNVAIRKVRTALGDSADAPVYVETLPGRGYRFLAHVQTIQVSPGSANGNTASRTAPTAEASAPRTRHRSVWIAIAALASVSILAPAFWRSLPFANPKLAFHARDWVLITNFENHTGEPVLDGTLEYALERELSNSQFVNVVPRERIDDTLRLMKKPLDSRIDAALGREICLRDGGIRALLTGRVEKLGSSYVLDAELVNPADGFVVASLSEEDPAGKQLARALRSLSVNVRKKLGESLEAIQLSEQRLQKVTTPSLRALQLYSQAATVVAQSDEGNAQATGLLEQALKEDPDFASAHILLAHAYANLGRDEDTPHFQRALDLADSTTEREKLFIVGSYYQRADWQPQKAAAAYEALLQLYPDHPWATTNLAFLYETIGDATNAARVAAHAADLRPNDLWQCANTATALTLQAAEMRDQPGTEEVLAKSQRYIDRAYKIARAQGENAPEGFPANIRMRQTLKDWLAGDVDGAHADLLTAFDLRVRLHPDGLAFGTDFLAFGQLREAEERLSESRNDSSNLAAAGLALYRGDLTKAERLLKRPSIGAADWQWALSLMIHTGMLNDAEGMLQKLVNLKWASKNSPAYSLVEGQLEIARGEITSGVGLLENALPKVPRVDFTAGPKCLAYQSLADEYQKQDRVADAFRVADEGFSYGFAPFGLAPEYCATLEWKAAELSRELGHVSEAERLEADLRKKLKFADADNPLVLALQKPSRPPPTL